MTMGFHASHEQITPAQLLRDVQHAEQAGFGMAMCSDHWAPWSERQGQSGYAWSWLGAALQATSLPCGVVTAPGQRYHPAVVAQKLATLEQMFPGRTWAALGSGENLNEHITGDPWPPKDVRQRRLTQSAEVMSRLLAGERVSTDGEITVDDALLWTRPDAPPPLLLAAVSERTAREHALWAEGLITVGIDPGAVRSVAQAYRDAGGRGPVYLQLHLSYDPSGDRALAIAHEQWRSNTLAPPLSWDLALTSDFDDRTRDVAPASMHKHVRISSDLDQHAQWITEYADSGFDAIFLHHVGQHQSLFIDDFGEHVIPAVG